MNWKDKLPMLPESMHGGIQRYIEYGIEPGHFLTAVICNDLREAVGRADDTNVRLLPEYVKFFYGFAPRLCWGSRARFDAWVQAGGLNGREGGPA